MATKFYLTPQDIYNRATALESQYRQSPYLTRLAKVDLLKEKILNSHLSARKKRQLINKLSLRENRLRQNYTHQGGPAIPVKRVKVKKKPRVQFQEDERLKPPPWPPRPPQNLPPVPDLKPLERRLRTRDPSAPLKPIAIPSTPTLTPSKKVSKSTPSTSKTVLSKPTIQLTPITPKSLPSTSKATPITPTLTPSKKVPKLAPFLTITPKGKHSKKVEHSYHLRSKDVQDGLESWQDYGSLD